MVEVTMGSSPGPNPSDLSRAAPSTMSTAIAKTAPAFSAPSPDNIEPLHAVRDGSADYSAIPLEQDIMQCARLGEIDLLQRMFGSGLFSARYKDAEGITPLHWAAINNQYATCKFLIEAGADVDAKGGESGATPAMWAAQRCHYYIVNLLLHAGTNPLLVDGQGYNILHLATIDGNAFLLVLLLHQEIPVDITDPQGHTSLMWAAYKGFPACVDLLLRSGANVNATDEKGLNALHWALVKGSQLCIQKLIEYGADRFAKTNEGRSPAIVAGDMRSTVMWHRALSECGYDEDGHPKMLPLGMTGFVKDRQMMAKVFFLWPFLMLWIIISIMSWMPVYVGVPVSVFVSFVMQKAVAYLAQWAPPTYRHKHQTPFLAGVCAGTLFWIGIRWLLRILPSTFISHPFSNIVFALSYGLTTYFFFTSLIEDPGYIPKLGSRNSQSKVIQELFSLWKFDEDHFCVQCMIRKPVRSKHCRRCGRCVAKHDHHCPWINSCVGNNNLRHFVLYILFMEMGIPIFIGLVLAYIESLPAPSSGKLQCNVLSSSLCELVLKDPWTIILTLWTSLQLIWVTMLIVVQLVQISRNQTTYENMKSYSNLHASRGGLVTATLVSGSTSLGPQGAAVMDPARSNRPTARKKDGFLAQWKKLLGLDAVMVTASDASSAGNRRRQNPFSHGVISNCKDFWLDPAPYFGQRTVAEGMLNGKVVNYARMYEPPPRTRGGGAMRYEAVGGEDDVV